MLTISRDLSIPSHNHLRPHTSKQFLPPAHPSHAPCSAQTLHTRPTMSTQQYGGYSANTTEAAQQVDINARTVHYKCGDCDQDVPLKRGEPIRCRQCGHRVLYKQRTNR